MGRTCIIIGRVAKVEKEIYQPNLTSLDAIKGMLRTLLESPIGAAPGQGPFPFPYHLRYRLLGFGSSGCHYPCFVFGSSAQLLAIEKL